MHPTPVNLNTTESDTSLSVARGAKKVNVYWILSLAVIFIVVFCAGFVYFYRRQSAAPSTPVASGRSLPESQLIDDSNQVLPDAALRHGKLILVFITPDCEACLKESRFLETVVGKRSDVPFYGVVSFGDKDQALREAKKKFPFKVLYDQNLKLAGALGIRRVPVKLFVENGTIKKSWGGATSDDQAKAAFVQWLEALP